MSAWVTYTENEMVRCPGTSERRLPARFGDRRGLPRPCGERIARVGPGTVAMVRTLDPSNAPAPGLCAIQDCTNRNCRTTLELCYLAATNEAA